MYSPALECIAPSTLTMFASGEGEHLDFALASRYYRDASQMIKKEQTLKTLRTFCWALGVGVCFSCSPSNELARVESLVSDRWGADVQTVHNTQAGMVLCLSEINGEVRFLVYDLRSNEIIFEDAPGPAYVSWTSDSLVEVRYHAGIVREPPQTAGYLYNVRTRSRIDIADFERRQRQ